MAAHTLRILQVMRAPVGGLFRHVADLTRELAARGHQVGLVVDSLASDSQTETRLAALAPFTSLGIHRFPMPRVLGKSDVSTAWQVRQLARRLRVDVLHGHGAKGGFYARLARLAGAPAAALYTPHGGVLHFSRTSMAGRIFHALERQLMGQTSAIIFESHYAQRIYGEVVGQPRCTQEVVHNGLVPAEFEPVQPVNDLADFVFVGELRDLKGVFELVEAVDGVRRPDGTPATLLMAGEGPARAELDAEISRRGLTRRITMPGAQPARAMFARGRVAVVPSRAESLPYVVLEAAAANLPLVATQVGGIPEIFGPTAERLVPANDPGALQLAMQSTIDDPGLAAADAKTRLDFIRSHFAVSTMTDKIEGLYRRAVQKK